MRASALASLESLVDLIDDINPAFAPDDAVAAMTATQRFQRILDFHGPIPSAFWSKTGRRQIAVTRHASRL
jgi:hypothetical protein